MFASRKIWGKIQRKENREEKKKEKKWKKIKNRFKINKLFLFAPSNLFHLFNLSI